MTLETRTCTRCGREAPLDAFRTDRRRPAGRGSECRQCDSDRYAAYKAHREKTAGEIPTVEPELDEQKLIREGRQAERLAFCAEAYDASGPGRRTAAIIGNNRDRIREMDRTGAESVREGALRLEFTRADCETTIRVMEEIRDEAIREMELKTRTKGEGNERRKAA